MHLPYFRGGERLPYNGPCTATPVSLHRPLPQSADTVAGYRSCLLTPNVAELGRIAEAVGLQLPGRMSDAWLAYAPSVAQGGWGWGCGLRVGEACARRRRARPRASAHEPAPEGCGPLRV